MKNGKKITQYFQMKIVYVTVIFLCTFISSCSNNNTHNSQKTKLYGAKGYNGWNTIWYVNGMPCISGNVTTEIQKGTNVIRCVSYKYTDYILDPAHDLKFIEVIPDMNYPKKNIIWSSQDAIKNDSVTEIDETFTFYSNNDIKPLWSYYDEIDSSYYAQTNEMLDIAKSFIKALCDGDKKTADEYFSKKNVSNTIEPCVPQNISIKDFTDVITLDMTNTHHATREQMKIVFGKNTVLIYAENRYLWETNIVNNEKARNNKFIKEFFGMFGLSVDGSEVSLKDVNLSFQIDKIILAREDNTWKFVLHP